MTGARARGGRRTWTRSAPGERPLGVYRRPCGCWWDGVGDRMWEPCVAHEADGHLSVISPDQDGVAVARCLVRDCAWQESWAVEEWAVQAAVRHWDATRG